MASEAFTVWSRRHRFVVALPTDPLSGTRATDRDLLSRPPRLLCIASVSTVGKAVRRLKSRIRLNRSVSQQIGIWSLTPISLDPISLPTWPSRS